MSRFPALTLLGLTAIFAACSPKPPLEFGDPETMAIAAGDGVIGPRFASGPDGELVMSWMERRAQGATLRYSRLVDGAWKQPTDIVTDTRMFVNWADMPSVVPLEGNHWAAHWLSYSADETYSYDVLVAQSSDGGRTWSEPVAAHTDGTPTEHGFVSMYREPEGVALLWLDGRDTGKETTGNPLDTSMTLRAAIVTPDGDRLNEQLVDDSVCDCCQTDVAVSSKGPIAVYRDRTADEIRDIYLTRYVDGRWQAGTRIHTDDWTIPGCPVNGPSIAADDDLVAIAWFSAAGNRPVVRVILSTDGGDTFGEPVEIADGHISGYVGVALVDRGTAAVSWVARGDDSAGNPVKLRTVTTAGRLGPVSTVGTTNVLRVVPQLGYQNGALHLAWIDQAGESTGLRAFRMPIR